MADAFRALGFDPEPLGAERDGKATGPKKRARSRGEKAADGLGVEAAADPSPYAHFQGYVLAGVILLVSVGLSVSRSLFAAECPAGSKGKAFEEKVKSRGLKRRPSFDIITFSAFIAFLIFIRTNVSGILFLIANKKHTKICPHTQTMAKK